MTDRPPNLIAVGDAADDPAIARLWSDRFDAEAELIAAVLAEPARGYPDATADGVRDDVLVDELCRVTWLAAEFKATAGRLTGDPAADRRAVVLLARAHLARERVWSNDADAPRLAALALSFAGLPYDPWVRESIRDASARVLRSAAVVAELTALTDRYRQLIAGSAGAGAE
jgi:hypothetical protein